MYQLRERLKTARRTLISAITVVMIGVGVMWWFGINSDALAQISIPNKPPLLVYPNPQTVLLGGTLNVKPRYGLTDNTGVASVEVYGVTPQTFFGTVTVDQTGKVTIVNAGPAGVYTVVIRAIDTHGASTLARFRLRVSSQPCLNYRATPNSPFSLPANLNDITTGDFNSTLSIFDLTVDFIESGWRAARQPDSMKSTVKSKMDKVEFNNDQMVDLAIVEFNPSPAKVAIMLGDGAGGFSPSPASPITVPFAQQAETADFNRDGNLDLAVKAGGGFSILTGNGSGGFNVTTTVDLPHTYSRAAGLSRAGASSISVVIAGV